MKRLERLWVLMAKKNAGEATAEELNELKDLLSGNPSAGYTNEIVEKVWGASLTTIPENNAPDHLWDKIRAVTGPEHATARVFSLRRMMVAASILLLLLAGGLTVYHYFGGADSGITQARNRNHVTTEPGSRSRLELPDGTQVWLNGSSELTYSNGSFGKYNREVVLTGEAFFDVVKDEKIPFIIQAGPVNITVKGTAFNVKAYAEEAIETSLVRGLVEITTDEDPDRKILLKPNEKIIIPVSKRSSDRTVAGNEDSSAAASLYTIAKLKNSPRGPAEIAWTRPQLVFDNEPFAAIAPRMESWFNIRIHFREEETKSKKFSGVIEKESLKETLEAMQLSGRFAYEIEGNDLWIGRK